MIPILIALVGVVLLALAAGFFLAISIGIRRQDSRGTYRSLREDDESSALSRTGSMVVGLRFRDTEETTDSSGERAPTAV